MTQDQTSELQEALGDLLADYEATFKRLTDIDAEALAMGIGMELAKACIKEGVSKEKFLERASTIYEYAMFANKIVAEHNGH